MFYALPSLALGIPAVRADIAPLLVAEQISAVGALPGEVLDQPVVLRLGWGGLAADVLFQDAGDGVGAGEDGLALVPGDGGAADAS
jgi:hypothetical protein